MSLWSGAGNDGNEQRCTRAASGRGVLGFGPTSRGREVVKAPAWIVALGVTLALLEPMGSLSAQTAFTEKAHKAEPAHRIEELRRAIRSPQAARERFEAMRDAQKGIEAAREKDQSPVPPTASAITRQGASANR